MKRRLVTYERVHLLEEALSAIEKGDVTRIKQVAVPQLTQAYLENTSEDELCVLYVVLKVAGAADKRMRSLEIELSERGAYIRAVTMCPKEVEDDGSKQAVDGDL